MGRWLRLLYRYLRSCRAVCASISHSSPVTFRYIFTFSCCSGCTRSCGAAARAPKKRDSNTRPVESPLPCNDKIVMRSGGKIEFFDKSREAADPVNGSFDARFRQCFFLDAIRISQSECLTEETVFRAVNKIIRCTTLLHAVCL